MNAVLDRQCLERALELAERGRGHVEPNPLVGCIIVAAGEVVGEGWHQKFGGPHAEVEALRAAGERARGGTAYVTLEPCCHTGKTGPCTEALRAAGIARVVAATPDPFPRVTGGGVAALRAAGVQVEIGLYAEAAERLNAPYFKLLRTGRPWVIAKWAMSLDGKIATHTGDSRWISSPESRAIVHLLRGRVDAILIGRGTAERDDPLLTARPPGPRVALRVVLDSRASLRSESQLVRTARETPTLVACGPEAPMEQVRRLEAAGCEVRAFSGTAASERLMQLLALLGECRCTNVLVEGGGLVLGCLRDLGEIDEVHAFVAPRLIGGEGAPSPLAGRGVSELAGALALDCPRVETVGADVYVHGHVARSASVEATP